MIYNDSKIDGRSTVSLTRSASTHSKIDAKKTAHWSAAREVERVVCVE